METKRFNVKLDTFLRRNLSPKDHERISASVLCTVSSPEEKRKYRHAVLGHKCVYLTDVPPKSLRIGVHLRDVISVEMLEDLPDFLNKKERENTVHIRIRYNKTVKDKSSLLGSLAEKSPLFRKRTGDKPSLSTNLDVITSPNSPSPVFPATAPHFILSPSLPARTSPRQVRYSQRSHSLSPNDHQVLQRSPLLASKSPSLRTSAAPSTGRALPNGTRLSPHLDNSRLSSLKTPINRSSNSLSTNPDGNFVKGDKNPTLIRLKPGNPLTADHRSNSSNSLNAHDRLFIRQRSSSSNDLSRLYPLTNSTASDHYSSSMSIPDTLGSTSHKTVVANIIGTETVAMDVYVLKHTSDFYHQLRVAWDNWDINQAYIGHSTQKTTISPAIPHERFSRLYLTLKQELLQSGQSIEAGASLAHELSTAAQKHFVLKKMFWEDCELFEFCVEQLTGHLTGHATADRIEYSLILMDVLYQMMRETHLVKKKVILLTRNGGHSVLTLASVIINNLPKHKSGDLEVESFENEMTEKSCGVIYELLQVCMQARWPEAVKITVSIPRIVESLLLQTTICDFCSRMVRYLCTVLGSISDHSPVEIEGQSQVTLHHITFILDTLICFSNDTIKLLRTNFVEEFRYFISVTKAKQRLPEGAMLSTKTLRLLQATKTAILTKQV